MKTAEERGMEMMHIPTGRLPYIAVMFAKHLCKQYGGCGEVLLSAWTVYAQCIEGLECTDDLYKVMPEHQAWFDNREYNNG